MLELLQRPESGMQYRDYNTEFLVVLRPVGDDERPNLRAERFEQARSKAVIAESFERGAPLEDGKEGAHVALVDCNVEDLQRRYRERGPGTGRTRGWKGSGASMACPQQTWILSIDFQGSGYDSYLQQRSDQGKGNAVVNRLVEGEVLKEERALGQAMWIREWAEVHAIELAASQVYEESEVIRCQLEF
jgi:hypothetical protein